MDLVPPYSAELTIALTSRALPDVPVVVITAGERVPFDDPDIILEAIRAVVGVG